MFESVLRQLLVARFEESWKAGKLVRSIRQVQVSQNRTSDEWRLLVCSSSDHDRQKRKLKSLVAI